VPLPKEGQQAAVPRGEGHRTERAPLSSAGRQDPERLGHPRQAALLPQAGEIAPRFIDGGDAPRGRHRVCAGMSLRAIAVGASPRLRAGAAIRRRTRNMIKFIEDAGKQTSPPAGRAYGRRASRCRGSPNDDSDEGRLAGKKQGDSRAPTRRPSYQRACYLETMIHRPPGRNGARCRSSSLPSILSTGRHHARARRWASAVCRRRAPEGPARQG
jgi:hypothetical protein